MSRSARIVGSNAARLALFFAIWLWIDDNVSEPELLLGIGVAVLATVIAALAARLTTVHARLPPSALRRLYRPPVLLITDSVRVTLALVRFLILRRPPDSRLRAVRYRATGVERETDVGRRILSEWGASVAPNRYAIGIDLEAGVMIVHELVDAGGPLDPLELG